MFLQCEINLELTTTSATVHRLPATKHERELPALPSSIVDPSITSGVGGCVPDMCWQVSDSDTDGIFRVWAALHQSPRIRRSTSVCEQKDRSRNMRDSFGRARGPQVHSWAQHVRCNHACTFHFRSMPIHPDYRNGDHRND
jgi:hypothetical protein